MHFNNPIPRSGLPAFHESSSQRSLRDSDVTPRVWQKAATQGQQLYKACQAIEQLQRQINRLRPRKGSSQSSPGTGMIYKGEWSSGTTDYAAQNVVTRGTLGEFIALQDVPTGTAPETGAPYWHGWSYPPPGVWA